MLNSISGISRAPVFKAVLVKKDLLEKANNDLFDELADCANSSKPFKPKTKRRNLGEFSVKSKGNCFIVESKIKNDELKRQNCEILLNASINLEDDKNTISTFS